MALTPQRRGQLASSNMGRPAIFRNKVGGRRVQAIISKVGGQAFEQARARLADLAKWKARDISDADVVEYLARGVDATIEYLNFGE